jgi:hypothetical protein
MDHSRIDHLNASSAALASIERRMTLRLEEAKRRQEEHQSRLLGRCWKGIQAERDELARQRTEMEDDCRRRLSLTPERSIVSMEAVDESNSRRMEAFPVPPDDQPTTTCNAAEQPLSPTTNQRRTCAAEEPLSAVVPVHSTHNSGVHSPGLVHSNIWFDSRGQPSAANTDVTPAAPRPVRTAPTLPAPTMEMGCVIHSPPKSVFGAVEGFWITIWPVVQCGNLNAVPVRMFVSSRIRYFQFLTEKAAISTRCQPGPSVMYTVDGRKVFELDHLQANRHYLIGPKALRYSDRCVPSALLRILVKEAQSVLYPK